MIICIVHGISFKKETITHTFIVIPSPQLISEFPSFQKIAITVIVSTVALFTNFSAATATRELLEIYNDWEPLVNGFHRLFFLNL